MPQQLIYSLPAIVDMHATAAMHSLLLEQLALEHSVSVDAALTERIATPGIQCLISARASFMAAGKSFSLTSPSPSFLATLEVMGLDELFSPSNEVQA